MLDRLLDAVRAGESRALVVRGEPGVGKTALLDYLAAQALGCRVARAAGVQAEMELAFAGLHQLLTPMLDRLERLPAPQRAALRTAFGMSPGPPPDRFLVALAVLSLLSDTAERHPLVCLVDDEQWLDQASAQVLGVVARRLVAESVGLVFAARAPSDELAGLPELVVEGLQEADARALLEGALTGPLDAQVQDRLVAEAGGNPLALLELPWGLTPAELQCAHGQVPPGQGVHQARHQLAQPAAPGAAPRPGRSSRRPVAIRSARRRLAAWTVQRGGRERRPAPTRLGEPPAACRHRSSDPTDVRQVLSEGSS